MPTKNNNPFGATTHFLDRFALVKAMDTIVYQLDDETFYFNEWCLVVPDCAEDDDFREIASDDALFDLVCKTFDRIIAEAVEEA